MKLAKVLLWVNPIVILFFAEVGSGMKIHRSIGSRKTDSYTPRFTIPAEGGLFRIKNPFAYPPQRRFMVELDKRHGINGTLFSKSQARKSRNSENTNGRTTKTGITIHGGTVTALPNADKRGIEQRVSSERTKTGTGNGNLNNIMKENWSDNSTQITEKNHTKSTDSILGNGNRKSNQVIIKGGPVRSQKEKEDILKITKGDMEANLAVPDKNMDKENDIPGGTGTGKITEVPEDDSAAITAQQEVTSIYIGHSNYTFVAAIHSGDRGNDTFDDVKCSGGILSQTVVVTSCSCLYGVDWPAPPNARRHYISVGHVAYGKIEGTPTHSVENFEYHPSCTRRDDGLWLGDIAMVKVAKPIIFSSKVQPMNLPKLTMWDASDILDKMSSQRRRCRIIGWSARAPMVDTAIGELIPLDDCANPVCKAKLPCPKRTKVNGFMVEITPNEPYLLPGALLFCSDNVFAVVNTKRQCRNNNVFAACSPEELLYTKFNFQLEGAAKKELLEYNGVFSNNSDGWETYKYTTPTTATSKTTTKSPPVRLADFASSASILFPFFVDRETSWIFFHILSTGYYLFVWV